MITTKKTLLILSGVVLAITLVGVYLASVLQTQIAQGSVFQGNEYNSTTTDSIGSQALERVLKTGQGALAQVTITGAAAGELYLYNATTSDATARDSSQATSSLLIAHFPDSTAVGTYTFDAVFTRGLLVVQEATAPTTTIMWR